MFYNDDFLSERKQLCNVVWTWQLMLILKRNFIRHVLNVVKCTLKSGAGTQSCKGG